MTYELIVTPRVGAMDGFCYVVSVIPPDRKNEPRSTIYGQLADLRYALQHAGWPELVDSASKALEQGKRFSNTMEMSDSQVSILLKKN